MKWSWEREKPQRVKETLQLKEMHTTKIITKLEEHSRCIVWTITNFRLCSHKTVLTFPAFTSNENLWKIEFYPHNETGVEDNSSDDWDEDESEDEYTQPKSIYSGLYLTLIDTKITDPQEIAYQIIIAKDDGEEFINSTKAEMFRIGCCSGFNRLVKLSDLMEIVNNNSLTIKCIIKSLKTTNTIIDIGKEKLE